LIGGDKNEGDERWAWFDDFEVELAGEVVTEAGGAHFRDGEASGGDDECGRAEFAVVGEDVEGVVAPDFGDLDIAEYGDASFSRFGEQHVEDVAGGAVGEELAELLFVPGDAVLFDESEEIGGGVAGERGFREVRILGEEIFREAVEVGEVAAASAGDEDFLAGTGCALEDGYAATTTARFDGTHEAGSACAEDEGVEVICFAGHC